MNNLRLFFFKVSAEQLKILFLEGDDSGAFVVPALDARVQVLSMRIEETVWGNQCFIWLRYEADSCLPLLLLICVSLVSQMVCCNRSSLKPASWLRTVRPMCDGPPAFSPLGFPFRWALQFTVSLARCLILARRNILLQEGMLYMNAVARVKPCRASSLLPCGFSGGNPY